MACWTAASGLFSAKCRQFKIVCLLRGLSYMPTGEVSTSKKALCHFPAFGALPPALGPPALGLECSSFWNLPRAPRCSLYENSFGSVGTVMPSIKGDSIFSSHTQQLPGRDPRTGLHSGVERQGIPNIQGDSASLLLGQLWLCLSCNM